MSMLDERFYRNLDNLYKQALLYVDEPYDLVDFEFDKFIHQCNIKFPIVDELLRRTIKLQELCSSSDKELNQIITRNLALCKNLNSKIQIFVLEAQQEDSWSILATTQIDKTWYANAKHFFNIYYKNRIASS